MKIINKLLALTLSCLMMFGFSACGEDDLDTNQYVGGVSLNVFGPVPVVRGGTLRFLGSNLDKVTQVVIPGVSPITDIEVRQSGVPSEILVSVPKDGPEVGLVTLITNDGKELVTATELTYTETIEFTRFSPASVMPGQVLTIEGDYLNLIHEVIFADEVAVPETAFITHTRYQITLTVPEQAQSGEIILSDGAEELPNWIYSEEELTVGTATVASVSAARFKAGETLTIAGADLNLTDYVKFEGIEIPSAALAEEGEASFTVNGEGTAITLVQPAEAATGALSLVMRSGVEVLAKEDFEVVVPTDLEVASASVKAGLPLTISGEDLDLVTSVLFPADVEGGEFTLEAGKLVVAAVPEAAVDGEILLNMANGMSVSVSYELVKPVVAGYSANPVNAGASLTLTGTDLDLVASVNIGGGSEATPAEESTETALVITVPMDSKSGAVTLTLKNGTTVEAQELTVNEALFCYVTEFPDWDEVEAKAGELLALTIANGDHLSAVEVNGAAVQYVLEEKQMKTLYVGLPLSASGATAIRLVSDNGEIGYTIDVTPATEVSTTIWSGAWSAGSWSGNQDLAWGGYDWSTVTAGTDLTVYFTEDPNFDYWQMRFGNGSWVALPGTGDINLEAKATSYTLTLTQAMIDELVNNGGLVMTGCNYVMSKIVLTVHISLEQSIWSGAWTCSGWGGNQDLAWGGYDWTTVKAGTIARFYYEKIDASAWGCISLRHGDGWGALPDPIPGQYDFPDGASGVIEVQLSADVLADLVANGGLVLTGDNYILKEVTLE